MTANPSLAFAFRNKVPVSDSMGIGDVKFVRGRKLLGRRRGGCALVAAGPDVFMSMKMRWGYRRPFDISN
jgi:hypothetical protein